MSRTSLFSFFVFLITFSPFMLAQDAQDVLGLPSVTPMNPETASLGRYGNVPINMGTGQMSYSIPIHTIQVDGNAWPVSLGYNYSGLILEAAPSLTGLGWGLNAHGAVRREVRGLPDGHENGYYGTNGILSKIPDFSDPFWVKYDMDFIDFQQFRDGKYDSEVDKYTLSAGGIQLSFKLYYDTNSEIQPYYLTNHNNHTVIVHMDSTVAHKVASFELITDSGVHYFFEEQETVYCEQAGVSVCPEDNANGWLLSRIEYLNGEEITFSYTPQTYFTYNFQASGLVVRQDIEGNGIVPVSETYGHNVVKNEVNRLLLNAINFPKGRIDFTTSTIGNRTLYTNITVKGKNANGTLTANVEDYSFTYSGVRDLLSSVTKNQELLFGFDYYDDPLGNMPPFVDDNYEPLDQDQWRYYNDASNTHFFNMGVNGINADRSINFNKTRTGAMERINYPTGGYTYITYQQNSIKEIYVPGSPGNGNTGYDNLLLVDVNATMNNQDREDIQTITFTEPVIAEISHRAIGDIRDGNYLKMGIEKIADAGDPTNTIGCYQYPVIFNSYYPTVVEDARNKLVASTGEDEECIYYPNPPLTPFYIAEYGPEGCAGDGCVSNFYIDQEDSTQGSIVILPGTYKITVTTNREGGNGNVIPHFTNGELSAQILLKWRDSPPSNGNNDPVYVDKNVGGIRVSKLEDVPLEGLPVVREFNYFDRNAKSSGILNFNPQIVFETKLHFIHSNGGLQDQFIQSYLTSAFSFLNTGEGIPVYYNRVEERMSNGSKTVTEYDDHFNKFVYEYPDLPREEFRSKLLPENTYGYGFSIGEPENGDPSDPSSPIVAIDPDGENPIIPIIVNLVQETNTEHFRTRKLVYFVQETPDGVPFSYRQDADQNHPWSFKLVPKKDRYVNFQLYDYGQYPDGNDEGELAANMNLHAFYPYKEVEWSSRVESETKKYSGITQKTSYSYNDRNYPVQTETINSKGDTITSNTTYPYEPLVASEAQYVGMVSKNQISTPVLIQTSQNGQVLSMRKINFSQIIDGYKLQSIETSKTDNVNDLEERVVYEDYDGHGNITQVRKTNGQPIAYLWGYNHQYPVAKIENATISQVLAIGVGNIQNIDGADLRLAIDTIRQALPNALVTTYTYKPLVGVNSVTDPKGYVMYYEYDNQNRLKFVKDRDGKVYSKNEYKYSTTN